MCSYMRMQAYMYIVHFTVLFHTTTMYYTLPSICCIYIYMYICVHIYIYVYIHTHIHIYTYTYVTHTRIQAIQIHVHVQGTLYTAHPRTYACTYTSPGTYRYPYTCSIHACIYIYICTHVMYKCMHTFICICIHSICGLYRSLGRPDWNATMTRKRAHRTSHQPSTP